MPPLFDVMPKFLQSLLLPVDVGAAVAVGIGYDDWLAEDVVSNGIRPAQGIHGVGEVSL